MPPLIRKQTFGTVTVFWLDREAAVAAVQDAATRILGECPEVARVVMFGSLATGRAVPGSDADILVLTDSELPWLARNLRYRAFFDLDIGVDIFAYRPSEVERAPVAQKALRDGIVLAQR